MYVRILAVGVAASLSLEFTNASFDIVSAQDIVNTVPNPDEAHAEFVRVPRPGGEQIVVHHVGATSDVRRSSEEFFQAIVE